MKTENVNFCKKGCVEEDCPPITSEPITSACDDCIKLPHISYNCSSNLVVGDDSAINIPLHGAVFPTTCAPTYVLVSTSDHLETTLTDSGLLSFKAIEKGFGEVVYKVMCGNLAAYGEVTICVKSGEIPCPTLPPTDLDKCPDIDLGSTQEEFCEDISLGGSNTYCDIQL